jgi:hypothetical protein
VHRLPSRDGDRQAGVHRLPRAKEVESLP